MAKYEDEARSGNFESAESYLRRASQAEDALLDTPIAVEPTEEKSQKYIIDSLVLSMRERDQGALDMARINGKIPNDLEAISKMSIKQLRQNPGIGPKTAATFLDLVKEALKPQPRED